MVERHEHDLRGLVDVQSYLDRYGLQSALVYEMIGLWSGKNPIIFEEVPKLMDIFDKAYILNE